MGFLFPIYWMLASSVKPASEIFGDPSLFPRNITSEAYSNIFAQSEVKILSNILNSFIISFGAMIGSVCLAAPAAYAIARKKLIAMTVLLFFVVVVQVLPGTRLPLPL